MFELNDTQAEEGAIRRVAAFDAIDGHKERNLKTILCALQAGLNVPDSGAQYDAFVMLREVVKEAK